MIAHNRGSSLSRSNRIASTFMCGLRLWYVGRFRRVVYLEPKRYTVIVTAYYLLQQITQLLVKNEDKLKSLLLHIMPLSSCLTLFMLCQLLD